MSNGTSVRKSGFSSLALNLSRIVTAGAAILALYAGARSSNKEAIAANQFQKSFMSCVNVKIPMPEGTTVEYDKTANALFLKNQNGLPDPMTRKVFTGIKAITSINYFMDNRNDHRQAHIQIVQGGRLAPEINLGFADPRVLSFADGLKSCHIAHKYG